MQSAFNADEKKRILNAAKQKGLSASAYLRQLGLAEADRLEGLSRIARLHYATVGPGGIEEHQITTTLRHSAEHGE